MGTPSLLLASLCALSQAALGQYLQPPGTEPNPPLWPASVHVFGPGDWDLTGTIAALQATLNDPDAGQFSNERLALLFKPGVYDVSIRVGYYVQVLGLGERVEDVVFKGEHGPHCLAMGATPSPGSLDVFWRGAENFQHSGWRGMTWAVSQASPLRRVHVTGDLRLFDGGAWASGGFMADVRVDGTTRMGDQQQWFTRNSQLRTPDSKVMGGAWNIVFVGSQGVPSSTFPSAYDQVPAYTNEPLTPVVAEKPFITIGSDGRYWLQVPPVVHRSVGTSFGEEARGRPPARSVPFEHVFVARSGSHSAGDIQAKLSLGYHVVFSPGIYALAGSLNVSHAGQVLLGIGLATLESPPDGSPCVRVASGVPGVRIAGLLFQAAASNSTSTAAVSTLLEWGEPGQRDPGSAGDPGVMSDLFMRAGGPGNDTSVGVDVMLRLQSGNVIGDNLWLWRADHTAGGRLTVPPEYRVRSGLEVLGDDVTVYGLFVEHTLEDLTVWRGNGGAVYFYQSELPYGVGPGEWNHVGYLVEEGVRSHRAFGIGVYSYFRDHPVTAFTGIRAPMADGIRFLNTFTRYLNGYAGILHVLNDEGPAATPSLRLARMPFFLRGSPMVKSPMLSSPELAATTSAPTTSPLQDTALAHGKAVVVLVVVLIALAVALGGACILRASRCRPCGRGAAQTCSDPTENV